MRYGILYGELKDCKYRADSRGKGCSIRGNNRLMLIYMMRHGQTDYNSEHRLQGQMDTDLNEIGYRQASEAGERIREHGLKFDRVYSSPLKRAFETARIATGFSADMIKTDDRLKEIGFGPLEGVVFETITDEERAFIEDPWNNPPVPGAETHDHLLARAEAFLNDLVAENQADSTIFVASHGMAMHALLTVIGGKEYWNVPTANCVLFRAEYTDGHFNKPERLTDRSPTFD